MWLNYLETVPADLCDFFLLSLLLSHLEKNRAVKLWVGNAFAKHAAITSMLRIIV